MTLAPSILSIIGMFLIQQYTGTDIGYNMRHVQFTSRDGFWFFLTVDGAAVGWLFVEAMFVVFCSIVAVVATRGIIGSTAVASAKTVLSIVIIGSWTLPPRVIACGFHITVIFALPMVV